MGCSSNTNGGSRGWAFLPSVGGMAVQRIPQEIESMELCSACGKGNCLKCKLWQFTVSRFVYDFQKRKSWDTWFRCLCQTGAAWRRERLQVQRHQVSLRAYSSAILGHLGSLSHSRGFCAPLGLPWARLHLHEGDTSVMLSSAPQGITANVQKLNSQDEIQCWL